MRDATKKNERAVTDRLRERADIARALPKLEKQVMDKKEKQPHPITTMLADATIKAASATAKVAEGVLRETVEIVKASVSKARDHSLGRDRGAER